METRRHGPRLPGMRREAPRCGRAASMLCMPVLAPRSRISTAASRTTVQFLPRLLHVWATQTVCPLQRAESCNRIRTVSVENAPCRAPNLPGMCHEGSRQLEMRNMSANLAAGQVWDLQTKTTVRARWNASVRQVPTSRSRYTYCSPNSPAIDPQPSESAQQRNLGGSPTWDRSASACPRHGRGNARRTRSETRSTAQRPQHELRP